jgi:hypothetical protein
MLFGSGDCLLQGLVTGERCGLPAHLTDLGSAGEFKFAREA